MKRTVLILAAFLTTIAANAEGIATAKDFIEFAAACNDGAGVDKWMRADSVICLTADIDFSKEKKVPQIISFGGHFSGEGHSIVGWKAATPLFGELQKGSVVEKLVIDRSCNMKINGKSDEFYGAFIAAINYGTISDCVSHGNISYKCNYTCNPVNIGAIVAKNNYAVLRCSADGAIVCDCYGTEQKASLEINVGAVAGGGYANKKRESTICWCTGGGTIDVRSDFPCENIGGVVGNGRNTSVRYCVNKASVKSSSIKSDADKPIASQSRVGGVVGFTKQNVACCDNFGTVTCSGVSAAYVGGIVGQPHASLNVTDCVNEGKVLTVNETASFVGGIAGNVGRPVHFRRCINRGPVRFDGVSPRSRSCVAGIVGQVYCPKSSDAGTYIRNCANYGEISSGHGGNTATANSDAIHIAGIVGYMAARDGFRSFVTDCANYGKLTSDGGRRAAICAETVNVKTGGSLPDDMAGLCEPLSDGSTAYGKVMTPDGKAIAGVTVTDGLECTKTDENGTYSLKSDLTAAHFIYVSVPADYRAATINGIPQFYRKVPRGAKAVQADFVLSSVPACDKYTVVMLGDPQVRPFGMDNSMERWYDTVAPDVEKFRAATPGETFCINLGDLVYNYMYAYDDYIDASAQIKCPTFNVMGNHDYDQTTLFDSNLGNMYFQNYISPDYYSFDMGKIHFIVLSTIRYDRKSPEDKYHSGLDDRQMQWLENDLSFVPKDRVIITCSHAQLFKKKGSSPNGSHSAYNINYKRYRNLLSQYRQVYSWAGHYHSNFQYNYHGKNDKWGADNIQTVVVSRCTGALRFNAHIGSHGEPQGYMVLEVNGGDNCSWYFKGVGLGKDTQMKVYSPLRKADGLIRANIWNWAESWGTPQWWEDGKMICEMTFKEETDPDYEDLYATVKNKTTRKYCSPAEDCYMFSCKPTEGAHSGQVRVTDQFGNTFVQEISW